MTLLEQQLRASLALEAGTVSPAVGESGEASAIANGSGANRPSASPHANHRITEMQEAIKALVAAQAEMTAAHKGKVNPAFRSKYAELSDVMDACMPALRSHGFAVLQPIGRDAHGDFVETHLCHEGGHQFSTRVYLILGKNDMQGFKSAVTYARRIGLGSLAGVSDTDDDGNAAAKGKRTEPEKRPEPAHDPLTGEVTDDDHGAPVPSGTGLHGFMDIIKEQVGPNASRDEIATAYAAAVIDKVNAYKSSKRSEVWLAQFSQTHEPAIAKLPPGIQVTVREAFARKLASINDPNFDPRDFEPIGIAEEMVRTGTFGG